MCKNSKIAIIISEVPLMVVYMRPGMLHKPAQCTHSGISLMHTSGKRSMEAKHIREC